MEHKIALVESRVGSTILIEGEPGVGKTHLLSTFMGSYLPETACIYFVAGSPFEIIKPYAAMGVVLGQYLESRRLPSATDGRETRTGVLMRELEGQPKLLPHLHVVNDLLQVG
jgi:ABC-type branched-subunit amino acid transport system ATPase component